MKKITIISLVLLLISRLSFSQQVNWRAFKEGQRHIVNVNMALDYGTNIGLGYGYKLNTKIPLIANIEYSFPAGEKMFDDFKTKFGGQAEVLKLGNFSTTLRVYGVFRRFENESARFLNFGSEFSTAFGYYKPKWYVAGELGFDKAITTNVKHSQWAHENNPDIQDGWYLPTGGNFSYGIQSGISLNNNDVYMKLGKVITQDFKTSPYIPYYLQIGYNRRF